MHPKVVLRAMREGSGQVKIVAEPPSADSVVTV